MYFKTKIFISALLLTTLFFTGCGNAQDTEIIPIEIISKFPDLYETYPLEAINDNNNTIGAYNNPMIILVMGQSNIANHGARYDAFDYNATKDVYYFNGYELSSYASPIGANTDLATGRGSTFLPYLGDLLLENTSHDGILFVNIAVGGSTVNEWNTIYRRRINYAKDETYNFDGMKCMFKFYFNNKEGIIDILVQDYYTLKTLNAKEAYFVVGSDVYGPMGHELIPFIDKKSARTFLLEHKGEKVYTFDEITEYMVRSLGR